MSNSIWHKASEKPELNKYVVVRKHGFAQWKVFKFDNETTFYEPFTDDLWAYVADIMFQADKAERLQEKLKTIANMEQRLCIDDPVDILDDVLQIAKNEIKQTTKEN